MNAPWFTRKSLPAELSAHERWPLPDLSGFNADELKGFTALKDVLEAYLRNENVAELLRVNELKHHQVLRSLNRCVAYDASGRMFGWVALIKGIRTKAYERTAPIVTREAITRGGYAGALTRLFVEQPDMQQRLDAFLLTRRRDGATPESRITPTVAHGYFLDLCKSSGLPRTGWPFCVESLGRNAIYSYVKQFYDVHYEQVVLAQYGEKAQAKSKTGTGHQSRLIATLPYDIVELDEHKLHVLGTVGIPTPKGRIWVPIQRIIIILAADRHSQAALGYQAVVRREANTQDVLSAVAKTLRPWKMRDLALSELEYSEGSGFPSSAIEGVGHCGFAKLLIDNTLVHLSRPVLGRLSEMTGCAINYGPVRRFDRRWLIELIFQKLESAGFQRVISTTGSNSQDPVRNNAERKAAKHRITLEALLDLIEMVISHYNATCGAGNFSLSPLGQLGQIVDDAELGFLPPYLPPQLDHEPSLDTVVEMGRIGGNREKGVRPHVYLDSASYTNTELSSCWSLIGRSVRKHINEDNLQSFTLFLDDGSPIGDVRVTGKWTAASAHSREARRLINAQIASGEIKFRHGQDPVAMWNAALKKAATKKAGSPNRPTTSDEANFLADEQIKGNELQEEDPPEQDVVPQQALPASTVAKRRALTPVPTFKAIN